MSGKLDQSLDEIMKDRKPATAAGRRRPTRKAAVKSKAATTAVVAPTSGVQKKRANKASAAPTKSTKEVFGDSKVAVSNLPLDVGEQEVKAYFQAKFGSVKRCIVNYGPNGRSRGTAEVTFYGPSTAARAVAEGADPVDGKLMKLQVISGVQYVAKPSGPKSLMDGVAKPKTANKDKPKTAAKATVNGGANGATKSGNTKKKSGRAGKPKAKTADELDAEMQDYFGGGEQANGTAQPAAGETMDEVL